MADGSNSHLSMSGGDDVPEGATIRYPVCAGSVYPAQQEELRALLGNAFKTDDRRKAISGGSTTRNRLSDGETFAGQPARWSGVTSLLGKNGKPIHPKRETHTGRIRALLAPHIDFRVSLDAYVKAFRPLRELRPDRVVLLATSHYSGMFYPAYDGKPFILSRRCFETPLGRVPVDAEAVDALSQYASQAGISLHDLAHRDEHSIELHVLLLQYIWKHAFSLVPVLVGPLDDLFYVPGGRLAQKVQVMASMLGEMFAEDEQTLFLVSGDLSHFGRKFGDEFRASDCFDQVIASDRQFLHAAAKGDAEGLLHHVADTADAWRICGFPPLYTALRALSGVQGVVTGHALWDERVEESAVTFGSVIYR